MNNTIENPLAYKEYDLKEIELAIKESYKNNSIMILDMHRRKYCVYLNPNLDITPLEWCYTFQKPNKLDMKLSKYRENVMKELVHECIYLYNSMNLYKEKVMVG